MNHTARSLALIASAVAACVALASLPFAPRAAAAHKFHTSFTEAAYDARTGTLEISLRTFPDDVEAAVRRRRGRAGAGTPPAGKDRKKEFEEQVFAYVRETFRLRTAAGDAVKLNWVGMDSGVDSAWLHFEAALPGGVEGVSLSNTFLSDIYDDQVNLVTLRAGGRKGSLRFERGREFKRIEFK